MNEHERREPGRKRKPEPKKAPPKREREDVVFTPAKPFHRKKLIVQLLQLRSVLVGHIFQILDNIFPVETVKTGTKSGISGHNRSSYAANSTKKYSTQTEKKQLFCGRFSESREKIRK